MFVPDGQWIYAPHLVFEARTVLAGVRPFTERVHANAYSIPSIATELGFQTRFLEDDSYSMIGQCTRDGEGLVITLNDAIESTAYHMAGLTHELGHAVVMDLSFACTGKLRKVAERNAWLRGIYVAISRPLAELALDGDAPVREIAARCHVPDPIVSIRANLAIALGEWDGDIELAYEEIRHDLLVLEQWIEDGREWGFREPAERYRFTWA